MENCPICNGKLEQQNKTIVYKYKNHSKEIVQPGKYCKECGEGFLSPADLKQSKKEIADFKREVDNLLTTEEIKRIRKKLRLTQEKASEFFGGGKRAFHKYETGEINQSKPLDILFRLLDKNKISINDLTKI